MTTAPGRARARGGRVMRRVARSGARPALHSAALVGTGLLALVTLVPGVLSAFSDQADTTSTVTAKATFPTYSESVVTDAPLIYQRMEEAGSGAPTNPATNLSTAPGNLPGTYNGPTAPPAPLAGATTRWNLDEGSGDTVADSTGINPGSRVGAIAWTPSGKNGAAVSFPAASNAKQDYVVGTTTGTAVVDTRADFTVMAWFKISSLTTLDQTIFSFTPDAGSSGNKYHSAFTLEYKYNTRLQFSMSAAKDTLGGSYDFDVNIPQDVWTHVAVTSTYNGPKSTIALYVNGVQNPATFSGAGGWQCVDCKLYVGTALWTNTWRGNAASSSFDEVRTFKRVLTQAEIVQESAPGQAFVAGETGALQGPVKGEKTTKSFLFNGVANAYNNQQLRTDNNDATNKDLTAETWFRTASTTGGSILAHSSTQTSMTEQPDVVVFMDNGGKLCYNVEALEGTNMFCTAASFNDGQWHHLVVTLGSSGQKLFVDAVRVGINTAMKSAGPNLGYWRWGGSNVPYDANHLVTNNYFVGHIDEVAVYDKIFSDTALVPHHYFSNF